MQVYEVNGPDVKAANDFGIELVKTVRKNDLATSGNSFNYSFPPHSFTLLKGSINK